MTKYFLFDADDNVVADAITDKEGIGVEKYGTAPKPWECDRAIVHVPYLESDPDIASEIELPDAIGVDLEVVVGKGLLNELKASRLDPQIEFLPVDIRNRAAKVISTNFALVYSREWHNVIDTKQSGTKLFDTGEIDTLGKWVIRQDRVPDYEMWFAHDRHWVVTDVLGRRLRRFANVRLTEIDVV